ncbi:hypothetical protein OG432_24555 [Streptomyces sp. NBC_00442]|uniref:hypothetical protein n=1 Tax=Streptomyces sp. NBC_00442 TaxID=2903651 RepID=UPI002E249CE8
MNDIARPCVAATCTGELRAHELATRQLLCDPCVRQMSGWLTELPQQLIVLRHGSMLREVTGDQGRTGTRTPPLPGRLDTLNLVGPAALEAVWDADGDQHGDIPISGTLGGWVQLITEERHVHGPRIRTEEALAGWLEPHLGWAAIQPWVGEMRDELYSMMRAVRGITQLRPRVRPVDQPCPRCDSLALRKRDWEAYTECGACASLFTRDDLALAARIAMAS